MENFVYFMLKYIFNPWQNENFIDFISNIFSIALFAISIMYILVNRVFYNKIKARDYFKVGNIFILFPLMSIFWGLLYWYIAVLLYISILLPARKLEKKQALLIFKNEQKGIYSFRIDILKKLNAYDFENLEDIPFDKYKNLLIPKWLILLISIFYPIIFIVIICLSGFTYHFIP